MRNMPGKRARRVSHRNCWEQWTREGTHEREPGSGATRKTPRREDRRIGTDDNRVLVWRRTGERYNTPTVLCHTARTAGVMVWGTIAYDSRSTLIVMRGTLTGQRYVDDILQPHTLPWSARSPDLSPVEHVWDQLKRKMLSSPSVHDLELAVQDLWAHLPQDNIRFLINSMLDRVAACIAPRGGPTCY
ncbi:transposable element Tc1 transposase [Trichonephila clavipes]|nr:transposable element Tc1 transposase [Trichonephila clavipes]